MEATAGDGQADKGIGSGLCSRIKTGRKQNHGSNICQQCYVWRSLLWFSQAVLGSHLLESSNPRSSSVAWSSSGSSSGRSWLPPKLLAHSQPSTQGCSMWCRALTAGQERQEPSHHNLKR